MRNRSRCYPHPAVDGRGASVLPNVGAVLLTRTAEVVGLGAALSGAVEPWRRRLARHDPVLLGLAVSLAVGGDCLADLVQLRAAPEVFGPVASDPTVSRLIDTLATDGPAALAAIATARQPLGSGPGRWPAAAPGRHRSVHRTGAARTRRPRPSDRPARPG